MNTDAIVVIQIFTIIVTLIGFSETSKRQRELLDNQKKLEKYKFAFNERNRQLKEFSEFMKNIQKDVVLVYATKNAVHHLGGFVQDLHNELSEARLRSVRMAMLFDYHSAICFGVWQRKYEINIGDELESYRELYLQVFGLDEEAVMKIVELNKAGKSWEEYTPKEFRGLQDVFRKIMLMIDEIYEKLAEDI